MSENIIKQLKDQINNLKIENTALKDKIKEFEVGFANKIEPSTLLKSIQADLLSADEFAQAQDRPTTYVVSDLNMQLKAIVTQQNGKPIFVVPSKPGEIDPNLMSSINITLKPVPLVVKPITKPRPVDSIEGIGPVIAGKLKDLKINTLTDLALASPQEVTKLGIPAKKADGFIKMAKFMVKAEIAGVEGIDEEVAELLVVAAKIDSKQKLAESDPQELYDKLKKARESGIVRVPKDYELTKENIERWVNSARGKTGILRIS